MAKKLTVSASPHMRSKETTTGIMLDVIIALIPALVMCVVYFGLRALVLTAVCVVSCVVFEYIARVVMKRNNTIGDLSAIVTGLILALNLPANIPLWQACVASVLSSLPARIYNRRSTPAEKTGVSPAHTPAQRARTKASTFPAPHIRLQEWF